jgi:hypothetical protein
MRRLLLLACSAIGLAAAPETASDLRGLRVGMSVSELPGETFARFRCAAGEQGSLAGWQDWHTCPADADGRRAISFAYAQGETKVAGHPVALTAWFAADGKLDTLQIITDSKVPLFLRKKAFLLGLQARSRYGDDGWTCTDGKPGVDGEPVGGVFVDEACRKVTDGKSLLVERFLLRRPGTDLAAFVGESRITITAAR